MRPWQAAVKRLLDVVLGAFAFVVLIPVMCLVALAVALDSAGPVIYGARRVGRGGRDRSRPAGAPRRIENGACDHRPSLRRSVRAIQHRRTTAET